MAETPRNGDSHATPFLKWAGGKRALLPAIGRRLPREIHTYHEPFAGGAAAFFAFSGRARQAALSDINPSLVITYEVVRDKVDELIECLKRHEAAHFNGGRLKGGDYYLKVRGDEPSDEVDVAARFIYLNRTCFNGLHRVNRQGRFNVPFGKYAKPTICDEAKLRLASAALSTAKIFHGEFDSRVMTPGPGDFVYADPPYDGAFTAYGRNRFHWRDQERLREAADEWTAAGAKVLVSNSDTPRIRKLWRDRYTVAKVMAPRSISRDGNGRGAVAEVLIASRAR